jgi:hypothetical protein
MNANAHPVQSLSSWALSALLLLSMLLGGCSNVIRSGLMNSNTVFLAPNTNRSVYVQLRNTSENQGVTLAAVQSKLAGKGYQLTTDPAQANYWIQAKVVYCHQAGEGVTPEAVAHAGFGAGVGTGGSSMASAGGIASEASFARNMGGAVMAGGMPDMNAMMRMAMAGRAGGFPGMQPPPKEEGDTYLCVVDVRITDYLKGKPLGQVTSAPSAAQGGPKVQQMRMVGHVRQKSLDIPEATPIIQEKISTGIAGLF